MDNVTAPADDAEAKPTGGLQYLDWSLPDGDLRDHERRVLQSLGAAVVARWGVLPRETQRLLFETAAHGNRSAAGLRGLVARFLHDNAHS